MYNFAPYFFNFFIHNQVHFIAICWSRHSSRASTVKAAVVGGPRHFDFNAKFGGLGLVKVNGELLAMVGDFVPSLFERITTSGGMARQWMPLLRMLGGDCRQQQNGCFGL